MPNEYPHVPGTNEYQVPNFRPGKFGLLVRHSDHFYKERGQKVPRQHKLGIVVDVSFYQDSKGRVIAWPDVWWEGAVVSTSCHPMNVVPHRKKDQLPLCTMDDGQWGTHGPPKEENVQVQE